jgi:diguanylate cyclase (GGDEF)-like protein
LENVENTLSNKLDLMFTTFIEVTGLITTGASMSRIVTPILACACEILGGHEAFAILEDGNSLTRLGYTSRRAGVRHAERQDHVRIPGPASKLYGTGKVLILSGKSSSAEIEALSGMGRNLRAATMIATKLSYRKVRIGMIGVLLRRRGEPEAEDVGLFGLLARQAAVAVCNAREFDRTQTLSITDGLTGAYNYRFLIDALRKEVGIAQRYKEVFSIIMIDVDGLKEYNDVHGHLGGSEVIKQVARICKSRIRAIDMLCKYGGDEFVAVLPRTPKRGAAMVAERLRGLIEKHTFPGEDLTGKITASFGISTYPADGTTVQDLIENADKALYKAKRHGRNLVWVSGKRTPYSRV